MSNEAKVMWLAVAKMAAVLAVCCAIMVGCALPEDDDDMGTPSQVVSWPLTGGLDTATGPLAVQPGSFLQLDDVVQERQGEWRNRYGFTTSGLDTLPNGIAPLVGKLGDAGMFALNDKLATYQPSLGSNRWTTVVATSSVDVADDISRVPVMTTDNPVIGFAQAGNIYIVASLDSASPAVGVFDAQGKTHAKIALTPGTYIRARCAATAGKLVAYLADGAGNLVTYVVDASTGVVTGPATIKTGVHATAPYLDALWDGSSATITVVVRLAAGDAVRFMEHNPSTGALATDVSLAAIVANSALSLFTDYSASGVRFVATSDSTGPTVRVLRCTSAGAITTNDLVDSTTNATAITGVGYSAGAQYGAIYQDVQANKNLRFGYRDGGGLHGGTVIANGVAGAGVTMSLDGQAWSHDGSTLQVLLGLHGTTTGDPQDSWVIYATNMSHTVEMTTQSRIVPLQAQAYMLGAAATQSALFQRPGVAAHVSKFALPVLASYALVAGVVKRQYSIDVFTQQVMASADIATVVNKGAPVQYKQTAFVPGNSAGYVDEGSYVSMGTPFPPPQLAFGIAGVGGSLTLLATYSYVCIIETIDSDGNRWRSPPSAPATYTLTGANNQVAFTASIVTGVKQGQRYRIKTYRTSANGFVYRLINVTSGVVTTIQSGLVFTDTASDASIVNSEVLYTTGETPTAITPRASHLMTAKDRLWLVNADFRTELWYSKNLQPGKQPEFTSVHLIDIDDNYGDITGLSAIDDNLVVFKRNAIYFVNGDGFANDGSGTNVNTVLASGDVGAIPGSPLVQAGDAIYFVSERGIYSVDRGGTVTFVGMPVDRYVNQPTIQTPERIWDGVYLPLKNEVRFVTDNYILVHNRKFATQANLVSNSTGSYWSRWKFAGGRRALVINGAMVVIKSDGTVWREGDSTQLTDNGAAISGVIRAPWLSASGNGGRFRLRQVRATGTRTAGGGSINPTMAVYFNDNDASVETFAPQAPIVVNQTPVIAQAGPRTRRCTSFSPQLTFAPGDNTFRLAKWSASVAPDAGAPRDVGTSGKWQ